MAQPLNETRSQHMRLTMDHRRLTYNLEVVQQPEKARACGSGPRSSADRRPVDPPPVVELRIFADEVDVTMTYDATFMLYASLEVARPIAAGKMHAPTSIPVLTGVAVASAAYLPRPKPAAYFIFPDLSVRHEGWYRLKFSLFEGVKHEQDADLGKPFEQRVPTTEQYTAPVSHESMCNRLEVLSTPFQVYSAKKFPGLNTSTSLSKLVADQGCRVRIRRDIRQRKRAPKSEMDVDDGHSSYHGTPQAAYRALEHSRSSSRNSLGSQYEADTARRASIESLYGRPAMQTRQPSIGSVPQASPSLRSLTPTASMPPPPLYHSASMPRPSTDGPAAPPPFMPGSIPPPRSHQAPTPGHTLPLTQLPPINPQNENKLPPLNLGNMPFNPTTRRYDLPETTSIKRSYSPRTCAQDGAMKGGARPDVYRPASKYPTPPTPVSNDGNAIIEPDNGEGDDEEGDDCIIDGALIYQRADGSTGSKLSRLLNTTFGR